MQQKITCSRIMLGILLTLSSQICFSQTTTINIGVNSGILDSTFVIQTGQTDSFSTHNHPGAGAYSNAEIYICQNATLKYNFIFGTSSQPTFYLEEGATLELMQNIVGDFYLKGNATIHGNGNSHFGHVKRYATSNLINMGASSIIDSIFTGITFTFSGWPGSVSPCNGITNLSDQSNMIPTVIVSQNTSSNELHISMKEYVKFVEIEIYNSFGQLLSRKPLDLASTTLSLNNFATGLLFYRIKDKHQILQQGKINVY